MVIGRLFAPDDCPAMDWLHGKLLRCYRERQHCSRPWYLGLPVRVLLDVEPPTTGLYLAAMRPIRHAVRYVFRKMNERGLVWDIFLCV